jgi:hypothetical protein
MISLVVIPFITFRNINLHHRGQVKTKDCTTDIYCFCLDHTALRNNSKELLARNKDSVSEWSDMSTHRLMFHPGRHVSLIQNRHHHLIAM